MKAHSHMVKYRKCHKFHLRRLINDRIRHIWTAVLRKRGLCLIVGSTYFSSLARYLFEETLNESFTRFFDANWYYEFLSIKSFYSSLLYISGLSFINSITLYFFSFFWFSKLRHAFKVLKSDSHVPENFCQIKMFPSLVWKNTIICLFGV